MTEKRQIDIVIGAKDAYSSELHQAQKAFSALSGAMGKVVTAAAGAVAAVATISTLTKAAHTAIAAAADVDATERKLATALGYTSQALLDQASALQQVSVFGDDQIVSAQAQIAMFLKDEAQIKAATKATLDFAAAKGIDLSTAGDLVAKTLGSTTNALSRYGIEVSGAVGSTERLRSVTEGIAAVFGGQAAAQAATFGGKLAQMKNVIGDVWEEIGFVITRNSVFLRGLDLVKGALEKVAQWINTNRLWLMELTKSGIITFVKGISFAVEALRFFHNGWLGLKLVANSAVVGIAKGMRVIVEALSYILGPFDILFQGLKELGVVKLNPVAAGINAIQEAVKTFDASSSEVLQKNIDNIRTTNAAYDAVKSTIGGIISGLEAVKVTQAEIAAAPVISASPQSGIGAGETEAAKKAQEAMIKSREAAQAQLSHLVDPTLSAPDEVFAKAWTGYQAQLAALDQYHAQKLALMQQAGLSEAQIAEETARMTRRIEEKKRSLQLSLASQTFGGLSSMMQNLTVLTGKEGGAAFKMMKGFAIAQAMIDTYRAAQGAYASLAGIPVIGPALGIAAAVSATIAGLARVKQISSMQPGGSAAGTTISAGGTVNPSYSGGSTSAYPAPIKTEPIKPTQNVHITIHTLTGAIDGKAQEAIIQAINAAGDRNVKINATAIAGAA